MNSSTMQWAGDAKPKKAGWEKEKWTYNVIKAEPGYYALDRYGDRGKIIIAPQPVIAWLVSLDHFLCENYPDKHHTPIVYVEPICQEELTGLFEGEVLYPDGRVVRRGEREWKSVAHFAESIEADAENLQTILARKSEEASNGQLS